MRACTIFLVFFIIPFIAFGQTSKQALVTEIFNRMCAELEVPEGRRPRLVIKNETGTGASYSKLSHTISIDKKLLESFTAFKELESNAIAFVVGHELCHALEKDRHDTHFLAYDQSQGATYLNEQNADIQGAFLAYISGYNCLPLIAETIEVLYSQYHLSPQLKGYPDKSERIESVLLVREQVESLIALFKAANLLLLAEHYSSAGSIFEKISQYYPSPEVNSNIAVSYILEAINLGAYNYFKYSLPIEVSWNLRLEKPGLDPGQKDYEPEVIRKRELLFKKADIQLKKSLEYNPNSFTLWNNLICLKILADELEFAKQMIKEIEVKFASKREREQLQMLSGTILLIENKRNEAVRKFKGIESAWLKELINRNLGIIPNPSPACSPEIVEKPVGFNDPLLQQKKIRLDTIDLYWNREAYKIVTPSSSTEFAMVSVVNRLQCAPLKALDNRGMRWSGGILSIKNPATRDQVFYTVKK